MKLGHHNGLGLGTFDAPQDLQQGYLDSMMVLPVARFSGPPMKTRQTITFNSASQASIRQFVSQDVSQKWNGQAMRMIAQSPTKR